MSRRKTTNVDNFPVPGSECDSIIISTVGYIAQHLHEIAEDEEEFFQLIGTYSFSIEELREILRMKEPKKFIKTKKSAYKKIFEQFKLQDQTRGKSLDESYQNLEYKNTDWSSLSQNKEWINGKGLVTYYPHPYDRAFVIDNSPVERKLEIIERKIENIYSVKSDDSWASISASTPKPKSSNKSSNLAKKVAVRVSAQKGVSVLEMETKLAELNKYEMNIESLSESTLTSNFRVVCEKWTKSIELNELSLWKDKDLVCRPWKGVIQNLALKNRLRKLITNLHVETEPDQIKNKIAELYSNTADITVSPFVFPKQRDQAAKHFVVEILSKNLDNIDDKITEYCTDKKIKIRPWRGKLPGSLNSTSKFV